MAGGFNVSAPVAPIASLPSVASAASNVACTPAALEMSRAQNAIGSTVVRKAPAAARSSNSILPSASVSMPIAYCQGRAGAVEEADVADAGDAEPDDGEAPAGERLTT